MKELAGFNKRSASKDGRAYRCRECDNAASKKWRTENPERLRELHAKWYRDNKDHVNAQSAEWAKNNPKARAATARRYYDKDKVAHAKRVRRWKDANRNKVRAIKMKRHAAKMNATPSWLTDKQRDEIDNIYVLARDCEVTSGLPYEVDHIVPLQGENVCGLHVPWNLQVLPRHINRAKWCFYEQQ
jgi:hypothetical protein